MDETISWENFLIQPVHMEKEVNFIVLDSEGYCCLLIPGRDGFELSVLDRALGIDPGDNFVNRIGSYIVSYYS